MSPADRRPRWRRAQVRARAGDKPTLTATLAAVTLAAVLTACGASAGDDGRYASVVCADRQDVRVPDNYCPIGDDDHDTGRQYGWMYAPYSSNDDDLDVAYVGYPVDRGRYSRYRPRDVPTYNLDRGRFPEHPPAGVRAESVRVPVAPSALQRRAAKTSGAGTVKRGGFGVTRSAGERRAGSPVVTKGKAWAPPRATPSTPSGRRMMARPPTSGRRR